MAAPQQISITVEPALEVDMVEILALARSLDLDCVDLIADQFLIAKQEKRIIGFGRLRKYAECTEVATVGVIAGERGKGTGTAIVKELLRKGPPEVFVTCVIPGFFSRLGFVPVKQYPPVLQKKVDFCKLYNFTDDQIFVMKRVQ